MLNIAVQTHTTATAGCAYSSIFIILYMATYSPRMTAPHPAPPVLPNDLAGLQELQYIWLDNEKHFYDLSMMQQGEPRYHSPANWP